MKLVIDMNLSPRWAALLAEAGFDAVHWSTVGSAHAPDAEIMEYARTNSYAVLTQDLDFGIMLALSRSEKPSVIQIRTQDVNPDAVGKQVVTALGQMRDEVEQGALLTVDLKRARLRILPLCARD